MNDICVIILNYNGTSDTIECIKSILKHQKDEGLIYYILDNGSTQRNKKALVKGMEELLKDELIISTVAEYKKEPVGDAKRFRLLLSDINYGFSRGNNECMKIAFGEGFKYFLLMNNDTVLIEPSISILRDEMNKSLQYGAMSAIINYFDAPEEVWNAGGKIQLGTRKYYKNKAVHRWLHDGREIVDVTFLTGCFLMLRRETLEKLGFLTEKFFFGEEDYEYCLRLLNKGIPIAVSTRTKLLHKVGKSIPIEDKDKFLAKVFIHYLNRFIDMRDYLPSVRWKIWYILAMVLVFYKTIPRCKKISMAIEYVKNLCFSIKHYTAVSKEMFDFVLESRVTDKEFRNQVLMNVEPH